MNQRQTTEKARPLTAGGNEIHEIILDKSKYFNNWDINSLIDFVIKHYHRDTRENIVTIYNLAQRVSGKHNEKHPELTKLTAALFLFFDDLLFHLKKKELILFPNITQLIKKKRLAEPATYSTFGLIKELTLVTLNEHQAAVKQLKFFRQLTNNYMTPPDACRSYKYLFAKMKWFERDLMLQIKLENDILFPMAIQMDEKFTEKEIKIEI